jgi:hypothetical protein
MDQSFPTLSSIGNSPSASVQLPSTEVVPDSSSEQAPPAFVQEPSDPRRDVARLASGLGFAALYGLALGARTGGTSLLQHALASSAGLAAVGVLGMPSLFVLLALVNAPVSPGAMLSAGARALGSAGFVLAGLAPSAALLAVTIESPSAAAFVAQAGLLLSGGIGLYQLVGAVRRMFLGLPLGRRMKSNALLLAFCVFAVLLAARVWYALPILRGAL